MDTTLFLLTAVITITTVLLVIIGLQLVFVLREIRLTVKKIGVFVEDLENIESKKEIPAEKKQLIRKKHLALHSILDKIRILSPSLSLKTKKFFVKEK
ncbi:hypothetical protein COY13_02365 [Candidatus Roizmanbacteria bacterium CG_4_10_14_0_2_um_filter_36_35]|uniref:Uncharacterized protein n=4 Tax=Candidatus Roizmaniibacteriota TaxID=1752723 RepID=A0A2M7BWW7_9BACT|nr:MAG: hypothetical protein COV86_00295 [Candidatus Roizmanbacteria bacterium CG11_big_fil_rev_8_21_14_0_20_35_14]PIV11074.1 MAG: hypothetical protein COS50_02020 [Candidatus Roizmanbacteria bacterium CG03_land_8_20_14_0_80_35_26]PIZ67895.1 MAG: hypothetical protein COY13_02365 [Candidatus Roizmanbacteria bacterium CG_4_10_14_0_2_um_filter_36_35]PJC32799.1 MAG: hypothetical protein CO049_01865 [Candidatus Roizmanbacteria bacterium CG_4_9_14_0_2_um_filter_36_12]PJC80997.1 MAG: hypothetical prot